MAEGPVGPRLVDLLLEVVPGRGRSGAEEPQPRAKFSPARARGGDLARPIVIETRNRRAVDLRQHLVGLAEPSGPVGAVTRRTRGDHRRRQRHHHRRLRCLGGIGDLGKKVLGLSLPPGEEVGVCRACGQILARLLLVDRPRVVVPSVCLRPGEVVVELHDLQVELVDRVDHDALDEIPHLGHQRVHPEESVARSRVVARRVLEQPAGAGGGAYRPGGVSTLPSQHVETPRRRARVAEILGHRSVFKPGAVRQAGVCRRGPGFVEEFAATHGGVER